MVTDVGKNPLKREMLDTNVSHHEIILNDIVTHQYMTLNLVPLLIIMHNYDHDYYSYNILYIGCFHC